MGSTGLVDVDVIFHDNDANGNMQKPDSAPALLKMSNNTVTRQAKQQPSLETTVG